jgi:hypothetical protein
MSGSSSTSRMVMFENGEVCSRAVLGARGGASGC